MLDSQNMMWQDMKTLTLRLASMEARFDLAHGKISRFISSITGGEKLSNAAVMDIIGTNPALQVYGEMPRVVCSLDDAAFSTLVESCEDHEDMMYNPDDAPALKVDEELIHKDALIKKLVDGPNASMLELLNISVISGGENGHVPTHVKFLETGMMTVSICGDSNFGHKLFDTMPQANLLYGMHVWTCFYRGLYESVLGILLYWILWRDHFAKETVDSCLQKWKVYLARQVFDEMFVRDCLALMLGCPSTVVSGFFHGMRVERMSTEFTVALAKRTPQVGQCRMQLVYPN